MDFEKMRSKIRGFPGRPGVYLMHDEEGTVLYVGKAKSLKKRVASYFRTNYASPRLRKLAESVRDISIIRTESEMEALIVEARLIKKYQPKFNVELKMGERYPYVKITREPFPRIVITRHREEDGAQYVGPFTRVGEVRALLHLVERFFPLRSCAGKITPSRENRPCMKYHVGKCLAPCAEHISSQEYNHMLAHVVLLLHGQTRELVEKLRGQMEAAAKRLNFEEAGELRDTIRAIWRYTRHRSLGVLGEDLREEMWETLLELQEVLELPTLPWRIDGFDISHGGGTHTVGVAVVFEQGIPNPSLYRRFTLRSVEGVDDFRSLQETVERRYAKVLGGEEPLPQLVLVDGGPVQLAFVREVLDALGLTSLRAVSLAKREETLYFCSSREPLLLPREKGYARLLQQIRDESHRFAVGSYSKQYHRALRRSSLEEIPGIGKTRAAQILGHFGSLRKIQLLSEEEIAQAPGVGPGLAKKIYGALHEKHEEHEKHAEEEKDEPYGEEA